jgi:PAS domain S-box-containing protein
VRYRCQIFKTLLMSTSSENETTFQLIVESTLIGMILVNSEGKITFANRQAEKLFGFSSKELVGNTVEILIPERFRAKHPSYRNVSFHAPVTHQMGAGRDLFGRRKDGTEFPVEIRLNPIEAPGGTLMLAAITDITERKKAEKQLLAANEALEAFSSAVSHDLRAPVRAIAGFASIIQKGHSDGLEPEAKELLGQIINNGKRMASIIDDLLKLAKNGIDKLKVEPVNMERLINGVWLNISRTTSNRAVIELGELPVVQADMSMMQQVVVNLLSNAIKYSSKKVNPLVTIGAEQTKDYVTFYFKDNGVGFNMKDYDQLFGAFQRLHSQAEFEGTGVGLTLVKKIIEKHGGTVGAEGKPGEGATFYFSLPL